MKFSLRIIFGILLIAVLNTGCFSLRTTQYVPFPDQTVNVENPEKGRIYVLRPEAFQGAIVKMPIFDQGVEIGSTTGGKYLCWEREPGIITISTWIYGASADSGIEFNVQSNTVHYILQTPVHNRPPLQLIGS